MPCIRRFHSESNDQTGFFDTWRSQQDHVFATLHERQTGQLLDNFTIDARLEGKVELLQRFGPRQTSLLQPGLHATLMPAVPFLLQRHAQELPVVQLFFSRLLQQAFNVITQVLHFQATQQYFKFRHHINSSYALRGRCSTMLTGFQSGA